MLGQYGDQLDSCLYEQFSKFQKVSHINAPMSTIGILGKHLFAQI